MTLTTALAEMRRQIERALSEHYVSDQVVRAHGAMKLLRVVELQAEALEKGCIRHCVDCETECPDNCPIEIKRKAKDQVLNILEGRE